MSSSSFPSTETPVGGTRLRRIAVSLLSTAGIVASGFAAVTPVVAHAAAGTRAATSTAGYTFTGINPCRAEDTRSDGKTLSSNSTLNVTVAGGTACTSVPATAAAVVLNVTTTDTTGSSYITVFPTGATQPTASNQNFGPGATIAAQVTTAVGTAGQVSIYNFFGQADVIVDVTGYFNAPVANSLGRFTPVTPYRAADTRNTYQTLPPNSSTDFQIAGLGIPSTGVQAAVLNFTVTNTQAPGYLTVSPKGATANTSSVLNWGTAQTIPNRVDALLGTAGFITVFNGSSGSADLVIDVNGYFSDASAGAGVGSLFNPLSAPVRLLDTRSTGGPIGPNSLRGLTVAGSNGIPANATAVVQNLTVTDTTGNSYLSAFPNSRPLASDDNWLAGVTIANAATTSLNSAGGENFYNLVGNVDLVVDASGYYSPSPGVLVTANPSSIGAKAGNTSTITAYVTDTNGNPVNADAVNFTLSGSGCGNATILPSPTPTGTNGQASATFTAGTTTVPGSCVVTATEALGGRTGSVTLTLTLVPDSVAVSFSANPVPANGTATSTVSATVTNSGGALVAGDTVNFTLAGNPSAACGTLSAASATTNASGVAQTTYTASTTPGFCKVTATETATNGSGSGTIGQTASPAQTNTTTFSCTPAAVTANGTATSACSGTVTSGAGAVVGDPISISVSGASCGTVSPAFTTTDASGHFSTTYTASNSTGTGNPATNTCTVTATEAFGNSSGSQVITQSRVPNTVAQTANPSTLPADGASKSTITTTVTNGQTGAPVVGDTVNYGTSGTCGTLSAVTGTTNAAGQVTVTYTAAAVPGFCTVTGTETGTGVAASNTITQTSGTTPPTTTVAANPTSIPADGASTSTITATVKTSTGAAVVGDSVLFTKSGAACGTFTGANPALTNASGVATITYTASLTAGNCTITATEANNGTSGSATVTQTAVKNTIAVAGNNPVVANGAATDSLTFTVTSPSAPGGVPGDTLTLTTAANPAGSCGTLSSSSLTTNSSGQATTTYTASTTPGFCRITVTESATGNTKTFDITQTTNPAQTTTVTLSPAGTQVKNANGTDTVAYTVTVTNGAGAVVGDTVRVNLTPSVSGSCGTTSSTFLTTNASGQATFTYTTSTTPGNCTVTATDAFGNTTSANTTVVQQNQVPNNMSLTANPSAVSVSAGTTSTLTATVTNGVSGAAVSGDTVNFAVTASSDGTLAHCGSVSPASGTTNAAGQATSTYTPGATAGIFCTVTATETGTGRTATATITQTA